MAQREVWITGLGAMTSLGLSAKDSWDGWLAGRTGSAPLEGDPARAAGCGAAAQVQGFKEAKFIKNKKSLKIMTRPVCLGVAAASQAMDAAGLVLGQYDPERIGLFVGAGQAFAEHQEIQPALLHSRDGAEVDLVRFGSEGVPMIHPLWLLRGLSNNVLGFVSLDYDIQGINNNYANSGASASQAVSAGADAILEDFADQALVGGYDAALASEALIGYGRLGLLASPELDAATAHRPFDKERAGFVPAEGAAFLLLEEAQHARSRGATPWAKWSGGGLVMDGFAIADPDPQGGGLRRAIRMALDQAGLSAQDIGAIFAHGASSVRYDAIEAQVYRDLLGARASEVPITADKSAVGHTVAASGAVSAVMAVQALQTQVIPPIASLREVDPACAGLRFVVGEPLPWRFDHALVCSAGVAGQAAAMILSRVG